jgi:4-amino-4-deoxychorismate lyase
VQAVINPQDRSFNYGDGIFTTVQVHGGKLQLWPLHIQRLQRAAAQLAFAPIDWHPLQQQAELAIESAEQVVKILISRGEGGRGYGCTEVSAPKVYISASAMPDYRQLQRHGVNVRIAKLQLAVQPRLAGLKHNNRLEQVLLKQELAVTDADELLVLDQLGYITEATAANVFFWRQGQWYTPALTRAGVAGVMRQHIMQTIPVTEVHWDINELSSIEAMFICNALMNIVPVRSIENKRLTAAPVQQLIQQVLC